MSLCILRPENDPENIFKLKLKERTKVKSSHTMMLHTYTAQPTLLQSISFLRLTVSEIQSRGRIHKRDQAQLKLIFGSS